MKKREQIGDNDLVRSNWERYQYAKERGHDDYIQEARLNEDMYLGGGLQWDKDALQTLAEQGRPAIEKNLIWPAINTAEGLQIQSRVQVTFRPKKNGASEETAAVLGKLIRQIQDETLYPWHESQVFSDGIIQQRGFFDIRMNFDSNLIGDIDIDVLDPLDVLPDPDANSYDPKKWRDVTICKWLTIDEIAETYGQKKADKVDQVAQAYVSDPDDDYTYRSKFGDNEGLDYLHQYTEDSGIKRVLVIDRQCRKMDRQKCLVYPHGDVVQVGNMGDDKISAAIADGAFVINRMTQRIRWTVTTADVLLHDDWSPYRSFTIVPYFPYFRRGKTRGMVDNLRSPQNMHNKLESQFLHTISTTANSGWTVEEGSLVNMEVDQLRDVGAKTGLVIEYKKGSLPPQKIQPNQVPTGFDRLIERSEYAAKQISGISDAIMGQDAVEISGKAKQAAQYAGQTQLARPLDNLAKTRHFVALKKLELIQDFYTEERVFMIAGKDFPKPNFEELIINEIGIDGSVLNDLTVGEYDVTIVDQPTAATFMDTQYQQSLELRRDAGVAIPDSVLVRYSSLTDKHEIMEAIDGNVPPPDPEKEAKADESRSKAELNRANIEKVKADSVDSSIKSLYSAVQGAAAIVQMPGIAPVADSLLKSAGYEDKDQAPIVSGPVIMPVDAQGPVPGTVDPEIPGEQSLPSVPPVPSTPQPGSPEQGAEGGSETVRAEDNI